MKKNKKEERDSGSHKVGKMTSIRTRTALFAWLISIAAIVIFALNIIPQQKRIYQDVLASKAQVLSSSIHDIAASAIVTEDYSEIVDHCMEILRENESVTYLVLTRSDGFSLIHTKSGWRTEEMAAPWRRDSENSIRFSNLVDADVYHYDNTFEYSGIHWGWVHVGISLDQYQEGVESVLSQTAFVAMICIVVGLVVSLIYANRLVKPILKLEYAVHQVANGDLDVRADIHSGDEVERLSNAFNQMTTSIQKRENLIHTQNEKLKELVTEKSIHAGDLQETAKRITLASAETLNVEQVGIWMYNADASKLECRCLYNCSTNTYSTGPAVERRGNEAYFSALEKTRVLVVDNALENPATTCLAGGYLKPLGITSLLDAAIRIDGNVVGVLCHEHIGEMREWTVEEENFSGSVADLMALAIEAHDRRMSQDQLLSAKEAAEAASEAKSRFLATMSHEIRTPLNGVVGMLKLLRESPLDNKQRRFVTKGILSSEALLVVINDVLDFSKIEAGRLEIESLPFDLLDVTENAVQMFAPAAEEKGLELACLVHRNVPTALLGDPSRIGQILINLLSNAIKFTDKGDIVTRVKLESETKDRAVVRVEVTDTGVGIVMDDQDRIFEPFLQEDSSTTRRFGGTGLGLGICRQLVELMDGKIHVDSHAGQGSTFWFTLDLGKLKSIPESPERFNGIRGLRVIAVDDHAINREIISYELETWGCVVDEAETAAHALEIMRAAADDGQPFDLAVVDWNMPGITGEELGRQIKADPQLSKMNLILLSSASEVNAENLRQAGFSAWLSKPARQSELYDAIVNAINNVSSPFRCVEDRAPVRDAAAASGIRILLAEDNEINQEVASEILKMLGYECDIVANGIQAVEAVKSNAYDLVFMDCMMPKMDGYEAARHIRAAEKESGSRIPVVALTANAMKGDREHCLDAGMDDYLSKPLDPDQTLMMVRKWTAAASPEKPAFETDRMTDSDTPLFDREALLNRCMGNASLVEKLITKFFEQVDDDVRKLGDALSAADDQQVVGTAHRIKGASANLSMECLRESAGKVEGHARSGDLSEAQAEFQNLGLELVRVQQHLAVV